jgi:hypothetical protein
MANNIHKSFDSNRRGDRGETVTFDLNKTTYEAVPDAPGGNLLDVAAIASDTSKTDAERARAVAIFLDGVLTDESSAKFAAAFRDKKDPITLPQALEVLQWLIEEVYVGRPTEPSSSSANGRSPNGQPSTAPSLGPASTQPDSQPVGSAT